MSNTPPQISLGELLTLERRPIKVMPDQQYAEIGIYSFGRGIFHKQPRSGLEVGDKDLFLIKEGDFILQITFAWEGAIGLASQAEDGMYGSVRFPSFRVDEGRCYPPYLVNYFRTHNGREQLVRISPGSAGRNRVLSMSRIPEIHVPLPPLAEQRRIVARIEELTATIEEARGLRHEALEEAETLVGAVTVELLDKLDAAPKLVIENIAEVRGGIQKSPDRLPGSNPVRYLTVAHVQRNKILLSDPRYFEVSPTEFDRRRLRAGDVLIIEGNGSADHIGRTAIFRGEIEDCVHQNHVIRIRPNRNIIEPDYLNLYLNSPIGQAEVRSRGRTTSGLLSLSVGRINQIQIPVPSCHEQCHIVAYLDSLQAKVDALKALQAETQVELDALMPSVLDKAFKGEL